MRVTRVEARQPQNLIDHIQTARATDQMRQRFNLNGLALAAVPALQFGARKTIALSRLKDFGAQFPL